MVYQGATGLYHFLINVIPFISNSVLYISISVLGRCYIYKCINKATIYSFSNIVSTAWNSL